MVTRLQAGLPRKKGSIPIIGADLSIIQSVHTGSGTYPLSYSMGIRGSFLKGEMAKAWSWLLTPYLPQS